MPSNRPQHTSPETELPPLAAPFGATPPPVPTEPVRKRWILNVLWWTMPLTALIALAGVALLALYFDVWRAVGKEEASAASGMSTFERHVGLTGWGFVPWVAHYNLGSSLLVDGEPLLARDELLTAYETVPRAERSEEGLIETFTYECGVRINLAVSWEQVGDAEYDSGLLAEAAESYGRGVEWSKPCEMIAAGMATEDGEESDGGGSGTSESATEIEDPGSSTTERLEAKQDRAERELNGEPEPSPDPEPGDETESQGGDDSDGNDADGDGSEGGGSESDTETDSNPDAFDGETPEQRRQREELEQKNREQDERQRAEEESSYGRGGRKNW